MEAWEIRAFFGCFFLCSGGEPSSSLSARLLVLFLFQFDDLPMLIRFFMLLTQVDFCVHSTKFVELLFLYFSLVFWLFLRVQFSFASILRFIRFIPIMKLC